ncbi:hypothetical protein MWH28_03860 [Natroniella sulfidigena]|uniref:hypothetical protein n=1 Tax=Natroniella sulfidigena TaxID=723921 RepID=UPI00200B0211|nr:hypothetical protein [Natroniella sulfidigena]MCK8816502.1 hypothetical protein [Natroniella sulfidigena]
MEYLFFTLGVVIILLSLILTYRAEKKEGDYHLESEVLAQLSKLQEAINNRQSSEEFSKLLNTKLDNKSFKEELTSVKELITELDEDIELLNGKIEGIKKRIDVNYISNSNLNSSKVKISNNQQKRSLPEQEEYNQIQRLLDQGLELSEVAQKLDKGTREVELICKLNSRREE